MGEVDDFDVKKTAHVYVRDVLDSNKIICEGDIMGFRKMDGTKYTRIILDPPIWIEIEEVE